MKRYGRKTDPEELARVVKKIVLRRTGFGCVVCGQPHIHFVYMVNWQERNRNIFWEITVLCGSHYIDYISGRLSRQQLIQFNNRPINFRGN